MALTREIEEPARSADSGTKARRAAGPVPIFLLARWHPHGSTKKTSTGRYRGLFIGVDRYASPDIQELRYAEQDAVALHALFADTLGDGGELLIGAAATRAEIERRSTRSPQCDPDDVRRVGFSGHGSETHELVTYDADLLRPAQSVHPAGRR